MKINDASKNMDEHKYLFDCKIENNSVLLANMCNFDFLKIIIELYDNIIDEYILTVHTEVRATLQLLLKPFFEDFGYNQKMIFLDIRQEMDKNVVKYTMIPTKNDIISESIMVLTFDTPHITIEVTTIGNSENPEFLKIIVQEIGKKMLFTLKQFIENLK